MMKKMTKIIRKTFRFSFDEWLQIEKHASEIHVKTSVYVRKAALGLNVRSIQRFDPKLLASINHIGNNLNQIARHANTQKVVDSDVLLQLVLIESHLNDLLHDR